MKTLCFILLSIVCLYGRAAADHHMWPVYIFTEVTAAPGQYADSVVAVPIPAGVHAIVGWQLGGEFARAAKVRFLSYLSADAYGIFALYSSREPGRWDTPVFTANHLNVSEESVVNYTLRCHNEDVTPQTCRGGIMVYYNLQ